MPAIFPTFVVDKYLSECIYITIMDNYEYFMTLDWDKYRGQFVVVTNTNIVLTGDDPGLLLDEAKLRFPEDKPFVTFVADKEVRVSRYV